MAWTDPPRTWVTAETVTAALLNAHVRDQLIAAFPLSTGPLWKAWTPTLVELTKGNGTIVARYTQVGGLVVARFEWTFGSTSAIVSSANTVSLPVTASSTGYTDAADPLGTVTIRDAGTDTFTGLLEFASTTTVQTRVHKADATYTKSAGITSSVPMTWTTNDILAFVAIYEAA